MKNKNKNKYSGFVFLMVIFVITILAGIGVIKIKPISNRETTTKKENKTQDFFGEYLQGIITKSKYIELYKETKEGQKDHTIIVKGIETLWKKGGTPTKDGNFLKTFIDMNNRLNKLGGGFKYYTPLNNDFIYDKTKYNKIDKSKLEEKFIMNVWRGHVKPTEKYFTSIYTSGIFYINLYQTFEKITNIQDMNYFEKIYIRNFIKNKDWKSFYDVIKKSVDYDDFDMFILYKYFYELYRPFKETQDKYLYDIYKFKSKNPKWQDSFTQDKKNKIAYVIKQQLLHTLSLHWDNTWDELKNMKDEKIIIGNYGFGKDSTLINNIGTNFNTWFNLKDNKIKVDFSNVTLYNESLKNYYVNTNIIKPRLTTKTIKNIKDGTTFTSYVLSNIYDLVLQHKDISTVNNLLKTSNYYIYIKKYDIKGKITFVVTHKNYQLFTNHNKILYEFAIDFNNS